MTWQATAYVLKLAQERVDLSPLQLLLCYTIAGRYSRDHGCAFGQATVLVRDTHLSESKIYELLAEVEEMDLVRVWTGPLPPRRDGVPRDGRTNRGLMYCFTALDPDGPDVQNVQRRPRHGGRPQKIGSPVENRLEADEFSGEAQIGSPDEGDRFSGNGEIGSPAQSRLNNRLLTAGCKQPDKQEDSPSARANSEHESEPADGVGELWQQTLDLLRARVPTDQFERYLARTLGIGLLDGDGVLQASTPEPLHLPWLEGRLAAPIHAAVADALGRPVRVDWKTRP